MSFDPSSRSDGFGGRPDQAADRPLAEPYGARTLGAATDRVVQLDRGSVRDPSAVDDPAVHAAAAHGTRGGGGALPHLDAIQTSFGHHDVRGVEAHVGGAAAEGAAAMGAEAFATGNHVGFASAPGLHTAAHEAAHVVQQRAGVQLKGGVGAAGDPYERHADAVADQVVAGRSAEALLDEVKPAGGGDTGAVQRFVKHDSGANWGGLGKAMRVSDDGKMAVQDIDLYPEGKGRAHQEFYATTDVASASSSKLGELQSVYEITTGAALDPKDTGGLTLNRVIASNKVLGDSGYGNATPLNCDDNTRNFMGVNLATEEDMNTAQIGATIGSRKNFFQRHDVDVEISPVEGFDKAKTKATEEMTGKTGKTATTEYADMSDKAKDKMAEKVHVNQFAKAELGGAYGVWGKSGRHFAPILAVSGDDQVALEAHVHGKTTSGPAKDEIIPGDKNDYNPEWYFQMYGPVKKDKKGKVLEDQTFYGQHKATFSDDTELMVIAFEKLDNAVDKNAKPEEKLRLVKHMITSAGKIADKVVKELDTKKYLAVQKEIATAVEPLRKDAGTIPKKDDAYASFLTDWADDVGKATIDSGIESPGDKMIAEKLRQVERQLRRVALFVG